jgi:hypothetical protein
MEYRLFRSLSIMVLLDSRWELQVEVAEAVWRFKFWNGRDKSALMGDFRKGFEPTKVRDPKSQERFETAVAVVESLYKECSEDPEVFVLKEGDPLGQFKKKWGVLGFLNVLEEFDLKSKVSFEDAMQAAFEFYVIEAVIKA